MLFELEKSFFSDALVMDEATYDKWAGQILERGLLTDSRLFWQAPFYPYFLALVYKIFGHNYFMPRLIQFLIGALSCVLVYLLGKKVFNKRTAKNPVWQEKNRINGTASY